MKRLIVRHEGCNGIHSSAVAVMISHTIRLRVFKGLKIPVGSLGLFCLRLHKVDTSLITLSSRPIRLATENRRVDNPGPCTVEI